jgi:restriction endonuclease S subunit
MRDGWVEATLSDALEPIANRPNGKDYPLVLTVTEKRGIIPQTEIFNHRIATDDISKYKVLEPMDIAYNPYLLWCGAIGQWQGTEAGVVSPVYECFRVKSNCEPRYLGYIFETGILTNYFDALAIGSIVRRRRTIPADFIAAPIQLPPLAEQKRIVDVISSVDSYIEALERRLESGNKSRNAVLHELLTAGGDGWVETTLDKVSESSWGNTETTKSKYVESGHLAYSATGADGFLDWYDHDGTAVVLSAIGAKCGKTWFAEGKWTSIKNTIWLKSDNLNLLDKYLFYLSNRPQFWQIRGQAQPFISLGDVKKTKVLLPPIPEQKRIIDLISSIDDMVNDAERTLEKSKNLRSGLLFDLLSGEHEIPTSYDKLMGAA